MRLSAAAAVMVLACGCGGEGGGSATGPSGGTVSVTVAMSNALRVGQSEQASATATLTSGGSQPVTTGFRSDSPGVATVTDGGMVTAVGGGLANVYVISGGRQGTKNLKVVPDFEGTWQGTYVVTRCTETGFFLDPVKFCSDGFSAGSAWPITASISQTQDTTTHAIRLGAATTNSASAVIGPEGSASVVTTVVTDPAFHIDLNVRVNSTTPGVITGTLSQTWAAAGLPGTGQFDATLTNFVRVSTRALSATPAGARPRSPHEAKRLMR
jgi:hypothetical protein